MTSCRHCHPREFQTSYASTVLLGNEDLKSAIETLENRGIVPCVTAVCGKCGKLSVVMYQGSADPYVHSLAMWNCLGRFLRS